MPTYIVRLSEEPRRIVFLGRADSLDSLGLVVDEVIDPYMCDYATVPDGSGVMWPGDHDRIGVYGPNLEAESKDEKEDISGVQFTEDMQRAFGAGKLKWRSLKDC